VTQQTIDGVAVGEFTPIAAPPLNGKTTKAELRAYLAGKGIDAPADATKAQLSEAARVVAAGIGSDYPVRTKDKVCIIGFAESSRGQVPWNDESFEFWGINRLHVVMPEHAHFDRYFQIHDVELIGKDPEHLEWLREWGGPVYLRPEDVGAVEMPNAQAFPVRALVRDFRPYYTNTISWLIAMAVAMEFKEIHIYGVDMAQDGIIQAEYRVQRPSCEYFVGVAEGRGIYVYIPPSSDLLKSTHLYGISNGDVWTQKMMARQTELGNRKQEVKNQLAQLEAQVTHLTAALNQFDGAMQDNQYWMTNWAPNPPEPLKE
jgi:hypothetical protein